MGRKWAGGGQRAPTACAGSGRGGPHSSPRPLTPDPGFPRQVQVNRQAVALPYTKFGLQVYESGINYMVDIPELGALVSYNGLSFSIRLPYRLFGNNTKGQCGEPLTPAPRPGEDGLAEAGHGSCSRRGGSPHCSGPHRPPSPVWAWSLWEASRSLVCALRPGQMTTRDLGWSGGPGGLPCWTVGPGVCSRGLPTRTGTCTNNTLDDCVLPGGEIIDSCEIAADYWVVNDPSKPRCPHTSFTTRRPATSSSAGTSISPTKNCASPLCELIKDR